MGIDFCTSGPPRIKLYYPPRDCEDDLRIETMIELCTQGMPASADQLAKRLHSLKEEEVVPATAYILGIVLGAEPSLKLSVAPSAYRGGTKSAPAKAETLALDLGLDPKSATGACGRTTQAPPGRHHPMLETPCAEFLPAGGVSAYYRRDRDR